LAAKVLQTFPLRCEATYPTRDAWYRNPYFGVLDFERIALKRAFSDPKSWTVDAGYFARFINDPAFAISLAASYSPIRKEMLGAIACILFFR